MSKMRLRIFAKTLLIFAMGGGILGNPLFAKEPTNWFFGFGVGAGLSQIDEVYPDSARNQIGVTWADWRSAYNSTIKDWGFAWELLGGYKHWLNNWVGFRYYANVSGQQYKDDIFTAGKTQAGVYEYTANADLLLNFYNSDFFTFGILAGFGVGGAYFDSPAFDTYAGQWTDRVPNSIDTRYKGEGQITKHHLSANLSIGTRFNFFQKIRNEGKRVCSKRDSEGRRVCRVPITRLEHSVELNAKFNMLTYRATDYGDVLGAYCDGNSPTGYKCLYQRPGYEVKNPYKFTLRYIVAF